MNSPLKSYDPSNKELLGEVSTASAEQIADCINKAQKAQAQWREVSPERRLQFIRDAYKAAEAEVPQLASLLSREMGKDIRRSTGEVQGTVHGGSYIAESAMEALRPLQTGRSTTEYKPLGIVAVISPWNYPLAMANNLIVPALMAGNSVIWKPSEETPLIAQAFFDVTLTRLPEGVIQIVHGDGEQGRMLVDSELHMIAFTGSQKVGKDIMQRSAPGLKRLVMELGGNDPMIVMADADIQAAARFAVASSFENSGQMCTSTERIYVDQAVAERFEKLVVDYARNYRAGPWDMQGVNIGPIINQRQHGKILKHISDAVAKGASLLLGADNPEPPYVPPTVITGMSPEMMIEVEETFGPLVCISRYSDVEGAIQRANNSSYGLGAVVFGSDEAEQVADRIEAGMVGINQGVGGEGDSPWVGAKQSGFGYHGSADGHKQFAQVRVVNH
jgi:acyl-CoA reductase-like NAD-dependent aldehyde dehydrogenase